MIGAKYSDSIILLIFGSKRRYCELHPSVYGINLLYFGFWKLVDNKFSRSQNFLRCASAFHHNRTATYTDVEIKEGVF